MFTLSGGSYYQVVIDILLVPDLCLKGFSNLQIDSIWTGQVGLAMGLFPSISKLPHLRWVMRG